MSMKKYGKRLLALGLAAVMVVPTVLSVKSTVSATELPTPAKFYDLEAGFRGTGNNGYVDPQNYKELHSVSVGRYIQFVEKLVDGKKPIDSQGKALGEYDAVDTVYNSKSWVSGTGYTKSAIPSGAALQGVPDFKTDTGAFFTRAAANQSTTAYDSEKGNVFWLGETDTNQSYPTYATTVDYENGTYTTDDNVIVKDMTDFAMEFGINNAATQFKNPFTGASFDGFALSAWVKNTTPYVPEVAPTQLGDVNGDGPVDALDALDILKNVAGMITFTDNVKAYADVNGDTVADALDALDILKKVAGMINEFTGTTPSGGSAGGAVQFLENTELFHFEKREETETQDWYTTLDRTVNREYLYFTANGIVYVPDYTDSTTYATWTLDESLQGDELDLLNAVNGGEWNYLSYSFDGTNFHMYVNGVERTLTTKTSEGYTGYAENIMAFLKAEGTEAFLGGLGGGMQDNFNTFAIKTSEQYYMDDIAVYTQHINEATAGDVYTAMDASKDAVANRTYNKLKTYDFNNTDLAASGLNKVVDAAAKDSLYPVIEESEGRTAVKINQNAQTQHGGVYLTSNPFAGKDELTGVTISYWMKTITNKRGASTDGPIITFIDDEKDCWQEKVSENYLGVNGIARSQLSINREFFATYSEGVTKPVGANSLKNIYYFRPFTYGDPEEVKAKDTRIAELPFCTDSWAAFETFKANLGSKSVTPTWRFVTVTINNAGIKMYLDGVEVENQYMDEAGPRFFDGGLDRMADTYKNGTNNSGARTLMNFMTDATTKIYLGYTFQSGSGDNFEKAPNCYVDDLSFYDATLSAEEVAALYNSVK